MLYNLPKRSGCFIITQKTDGIFIFRDDNISEIKKPQEVSIKTHSQGNLNIPQKTDVVNNNLKQEELDKQYFAAIEAGDMETVQKLVNEQAEKKGYLGCITSRKGEGVL